jgi:hypothetical protein
MIYNLRELATESRNSPLTSEQIQSIHNHYRLERTPEDHQKAFQIVLDHELALLKPEQAERVRALEKDYLVRTSKQLNGELSLNYSGESKQAKRRVFVDLSEKYQGTELESILKFHEFFHSIQYEKLRELGKNDLAVDHLLTTLKGRYVFEQGAMQAEWKFARTIPLSVRRNLITELSNDPTISDQWREFGIRLLNGEDKKLSSYLLQEYRAGRYSKTAIQAREERLIRTLLIRLGTISTATSAFFYIDYTCTSQVDDHGNYPDTQFFKEICLKAPLTGTSIKALIASRKPKS